MQGGSTATQTAERQILFTVLDKNSSFVDTLQAADVRLIENDKPQGIVAFRRLDDQPLLLAILIDTSASQRETFPNQKIAADSFVQAIMRPGKDQGTLISFAGSAIVEQDMTKDPALVRQAIAHVQLIPPPGILSGILGTTLRGATALWDAIWATSDELMPPALAGARKAIILLSDGQDTISRVKKQEAIEHAVQANVVVYAIGIGDDHNFDGVDKGALRKLSEQTGGRAFFPKKSQDLEEAFIEIQQEIRNQYEITYRSVAGKTGSPRKVRLEIINPALRPKELQIFYQRIGLGPGK